MALKSQNNKYFLLQFVFPDSGKRSSKSCGVNFDEEGIILAVSKAHKVKDALSNFSIVGAKILIYEKIVDG